jgi:NADPH:quinone reductase-like Zn-dependent oxidoreductase
MSGQEQELEPFPAKWNPVSRKKMLPINHRERDVMKSFQVAEFNAPLKEVDRPTPQPEGTQVLIKVKAAGVCHSDLHIWEGGYDLGHGRKPLSLKDRGVSLPRTMGHETVGEVLAFGPDAKAHYKGDLKVGDIALAYPGSVAAGARPVSAVTRTCASSGRMRSASIAMAAMPIT